MDPRWRPESMKPKTQEAAAGPEAPISAGMARPRRQRAGLKRAWDWQDDGSWLGSGEDSASAGSSLQTASSSPGGLRRAKRPRRTLGQPQPPQQPAQRAAGSSGSGGGGGAYLACVASPVVGTSSAGAALEAVAPAGQLGSPKAAGLPTAVATEPAPDAGAHDAPAGPQHLPPSVHVTQFAAAQSPTTPASGARDEVPGWQREPLPHLPLVPAQPWRAAPAAARALTLGIAAPASMQAMPGVHMLHVLVPLTARQQWQQQLTQGGGPWVAGPPAGAAWQPASAAGCTPPPAPLLQSLGPHSAPPQWWQQQQLQKQAAARAALPLLWAEVAQLASPAAAPDTCSLRRYEEEQRRYEERWRQYQREEEEHARAEAALLGGQSSQRSWAQQAEQALPTQQAGRDEPAGTPTPAAQPPNRGLPAIPYASAEPIRSLSAAAAACGAAGRQVDAGTLPPPEHPPASPLLKASQRHPSQQKVQQAEAQLPQEQEEPEDPSDLTPAGSLGAALGTLYSAWQDGQLALPMAPE